MNIYVCTYIINLHICACNIYAYTYICMHITYAHILTMIKEAMNVKREKGMVYWRLWREEREGKII